MEASNPAATEFRTTLGALGLAQRRVAQLFGVGPRSVRRWQRGDRRLPLGVDIVFRLMAMGAVTIAQVEQAAVLIAARTKGGAKRESLAPLPVAPAPEQSALARAEAVTPANSNLTVAEKVLALAPRACRWPCGNLEHPDFHFCGSSSVKGSSYCEHHHVLAHMAAPTRAGRLLITWRHLALPSRSLSLPARPDHTR